MREEMMRDRVEKLILDSYESMYRMAFIYMKNESDAMDVVQDSVEKALKNAGSLREDSYMKTWLFRIVINTALDELRRRARLIPIPAGREAGREDRYCDFDTLRSLEKLDETEKTVILLRYCEEWKLEEMAEYLGKNINTVKSILYRSLKKLKAELGKEAVS